MVKVLVTGANGYIGNAVAAGLRRAGHIVYGLSRTEDKGKELLKQEIRPVIGDIDDIASYASIVDQVSVVVDTVMTNSRNVSNEKVLNEVIRASKAGGYKKRYIYTSGCLVYGDRPNELLDEWSIPKPGPFLQWRFDYENKLAATHDIQTAIVRPGFVYGGKSANMLDFSSSEANGEITVFGNPNKIWPWVHIDDLADAYVRVVESSLHFTGHIYNVGDDSRWTFQQLREAFAKACGAKGPVVNKPNPPNDFWANFCDKTVTVSSQRIKNDLGWNPKKSLVLDELDFYISVAKLLK